MAGKRGIRLRINHQRLEALIEICDEMLEEFSPNNEHQYLLKEYLDDLTYKLKEMIRRGQEIYTLMLCGAESMAFYQLWKSLDISHDKYAMLVVENMLGKMSRIAV